MALQVLRSNSLRPLLDGLVAIATAPTSPFDRLPVVVHSRGLERYLAMHLADRLGVCANVDFPHPNTFFGDLLPQVLGPEADPDAWSTDRLTLAFLDAVADREVMQHPAMGPIRAYLDGSPGDRKSAALAGKVATLFERYAHYRPELVARWAAGADDGWEAVLWRAIASRLPGSDLGTLVARFEAASLDAPFPARAAVFSVATLPPLSVRLLAAIARRVDVSLFVFAPSRAMWHRIAQQAERIREREGMPAPSDLDLAVDHPLLASCGNTARDFQISLLRYAPDARHNEVVREPATHTVLGLLQSDLLHDRVPPPGPLPETESVRFHACPGPIRQAQVLRDVLLRLFDTVPDLQPREVVVMAPDIATWAPLVHAELADAAPWIPYRVADRGVRHENPAAQALLAVLDLVGARLTASELSDLLALDPVRTRFGIAAEQLPTLRGWALEAGIRWARDAEHREAVGQPRTEAFTWRSGLDRLLLGQAMATDPVVLDALPYGEIEGIEPRDLLGRFVDFVETLFAELVDLERPRTVPAWAARLVALLDRMVGSTAETSWQIEQVRQGLASLAEDGGRFERTLDLPAIRLLLEGRFGAQEPGQGFLQGSVTICQLVPMRAIPFRVVVLLGMDEGRFPRGGAPLGFDRMGDRRLGDRSVREDDRALFLEALLAAEERLVVLYTGRDPVGNRPLPPAIPVGELLDALDARFTTPDGRPVRDHLVVRHALHPFSSEAFAPEAGRDRSHDERMRRAAEAWVAGTREPEPPRPFLTAPLPEPEPVVPTVDELARFWQSPVDHLLTRRLGLYERETEDSPRDREPLNLEALEHWKVRDVLLRERLAGRALTRPGEAWDRVSRAALLPLGEPGRQLYDTLAGEADAIADRASPYLQPPDAPVDVELPDLTGRVRGVHGADRVEVQAGMLRAKHRIAAWVRHLAWQVRGGSGRSRLFGLRSEVTFGPVGGADALLADLLHLFAVGQRHPLLFFPATSHAWALAERDRAGFPDQWHDQEGMPRFDVDFPFSPGADLRGLPVPGGLDAPSLAVRIWGPALRHEEVS